MNEVLRRAALVAALLAGSLLAFTTALAAPDPDRAAFEAASLRWMSAVNSRDGAVLARTMTTDVELLDPHGSTVTGRDAAIVALRDLAARGQLVATTREMTLAGDVAWRVVRLTQTRKNGDVHSLGQALEIWKRVHGEWKLHRQMAAGVSSQRHSLTRPPANEPVLDPEPAPTPTPTPR